MAKKPAESDPYASLPEAADPYASLPEPSAAAPTTPQEPFYQRLGPVGRFFSSAVSQYGIPESVQEHPTEAVQGLGMAVRQPGLELASLKEMYNNMTKAQQDLIDEAFFKQHMPDLKNKAEGFALGVYSAIPVFGPALAEAGKKFQSGDVAGGLGAMVGIITQFYRPQARVATEPVRGAPGTMGVLPPPSGGTVRATAQRLAGIGPERTTEPIVEKFLEQAKDLQEKNIKKTDAAFRQAGEEKATFEQKVREQAQDYRTKVQGVQDFNRAQEEMAGRKEALSELNEVESADLGVDLATLESDVYKEANRRFNDVRKEVAGQQRPPDTLISVVKDTEKNVLQGIPENVKEFRRILGLEGESGDLKDLRQDVMQGQGMTGRYEDLPQQHKALVDDIVARWGGQIDPNTPLSWDLLQALKSRLDRRLRSGRAMNGFLKQGLFGVRDAVVDEMGGMVGDRMAAGGPPTLLDDWLNARTFYREWREDFHTPGGPSGSGSPIAQAIDAVDPARVRRPFLGDAQARAIATLQKYGQFGGQRVADRAQRIIARQSEFERLKPAKAKTVPAPPKEIPRPKPVEAEIEGIAPPSREDLILAKRKALRDTAVSWFKLHTYDLGILAGSVLRAFTGNWADLLLDPAFVSIRKSFGRVVSRSDVRAWLTQPLPEEMELVNRLPEVLKEDLRDKMFEYIRTERKVSKGRPLKLATPVQAFLGITRKPKKPGEQIRDLGQLTGSNPALPVGVEQ